MAMVMDLDFSNFNFNYCPSTTTTTTTSTTTTTTTDEICNWSDFPPVVDWEALSGDQEDFHNLIDSMMEENSTIIHHQFLDQTLIEDYNDLSPEFNTDILGPDQEKGSAEYSNMDSSEEDSKGLRLIHLLMAAAEALGSEGPSRSRELARVILVRLKELASPNDGSNMERLAAHFTDALQGLLEGGAGCNNNKAHNHQGKNNGRCYYKDDHYHHHHHHQSDVLAAFQLLQDMSPYAKFGHFTANQAILEAVANDRRVHIVDYDIMEGVQWASFMQALASRKDGPPGPHLRITALSRGGSSSGRSSLGTVQETGRRLTAFAASIGQPFSFHHCRLDPDEKFRPGNIKLVRGEALIVNCVLHMPHFSCRAHGSIESFLSGSKSLNPRLVTLVEEETGPVLDGGFVGRFMDSLHHYSAVYDSLESGFPLQGRARTLVERVFLGPRICDSLGRIYRAREDEEGCSWARWLGAAGFSPVRISYANHCQAKLLVGLYNDGYKVEELSDNKLVLGWKSRRLFSASIWTFQDYCDL